MLLLLWIFSDRWTACHDLLERISFVHIEGQVLLQLADSSARFLVLHEALLRQLVVRLHESLVECDKLFHLAKSVLVHLSLFNGSIILRKWPLLQLLLHQVLTLLLLVQQLLLVLDLSFDEGVLCVIKLSPLHAVIPAHQLSNIVQ